MTKFIKKPAILSLKIKLKPLQNSLFADWQAKLNNVLIAQPGFVSLEFISPSKNTEEWIVTQRFADFKQADDWKLSSAYIDLKNELQNLSIPRGIKEDLSEGFSSIDNGVTEVIVAEVLQDKEDMYREWSSKIHALEAKFPGFRGTYVQSPSEIQGKYWLTLLQFDTMDNLDRWLNSSEREKLLAESASMISYLETHRVISPYAGWFSSIVKTGEVPPAWKQAMIVLLVLFPIVMLEILYLNPRLTHLNLSLSTFIGNVLSVALLTFPMMPIAIYFLKWWLMPQSKYSKTFTAIGTLLLLALYLLEIWIFWV